MCQRGLFKAWHITIGLCLKGSYVPFTSQELEAAKQPNFYFPPFYGDFIGGGAQTGKGDPQDFQLVYRSSQAYQSLVTLTFVADSVYFVTNV